MSVKKEKSNSSFYVNTLKSIYQEDNVKCKSLFLFDYYKKMNIENLMHEICNSENVIFVYPIYNTSISSEFLYFLIIMEEYINKEVNTHNSPRIYAVANLGYYEGEYSKNSFDIIKNFCNKVNFNWRFGVGIGIAGITAKTEKLVSINSIFKFNIKSALRKICRDTQTNSEKNVCNIYTRFKVSKIVARIICNSYWKKQMKKKYNFKKSELPKIE